MTLFAGPVFPEWYWGPILFAIVYGPVLAVAAFGADVAVRRWVRPLSWPQRGWLWAGCDRRRHRADPRRRGGEGERALQP